LGPGAAAELAAEAAACAAALTAGGRAAADAAFLAHAPPVQRHDLHVLLPLAPRPAAADVAGALGAADATPLRAEEAAAEAARAKALGGEATVTSEVGAGTTVTKLRSGAASASSAPAGTGGACVSRHSHPTPVGIASPGLRSKTLVHTSRSLQCASSTRPPSPRPQPRSSAAAPLRSIIRVRFKP
jgi:hypothetical protein